MLDEKKRIRKGDKVRWESQSQGVWKEKKGVVLDIIPAGVDAYPYIPLDAKTSHIKLGRISENERALVAVQTGKDGNITHYYSPKLCVLQKIERDEQGWEEHYQSRFERRV